jgi:DNA mismatch repair protein MutL
MVIAPLPQATVQLLGSTQALTTPTSLVKELVDNALDAKALSIDIIISPNTIDKIEVRDNGHGIQQEDLDALGRRGHTSKMRSFDELKSIGGISLGFRGEALASAVQLGEVVVTTRTEGESVATTVKLKAPGGIDCRSRASHPIGTTVSVTKFMYKLPVRKQTVLKEASKTLSKIKELLQAYVLARPNIKFSFKVLKENKASWSYAPRPKDGIKEAVSQIFGKDVVNQCISKSIRFLERTHDVDATLERGNDLPTVNRSPGPQSHEFIVDVFLPRPDADLSKIGHGQYISVDSRPVSHEKNTMKRIVTIFKYYMKESILESSEKAKSPFLCLNISCPAGSYDPNVEPAKTDVIFGNESVVLEAIENLFKEIYGGPKVIATITPTQLLKEKLDNFELLLAREPAVLSADNCPVPPAEEVMPKHPLEAAASQSPASSSPYNDIAETEGNSAVDKEAVDEVVERQRRKWAFDMSKDLSEEVEGYERPSRRFQQQPNIQPSAYDAESTVGTSINPWVIAKMTAPLQPRAQLAHTSSRAFYSISRPSAALQTPHLSSDSLPSDSDIEFIDESSRPRQTFRNDDVQSLDVSMVQNLPYERPGPGFVHRTTLLPTRRPLNVDAEDEMLLSMDESGAHQSRNDFVSARNIPDAALLSPPASSGQKKSKGVNKPFVPPIRRNKEKGLSSNFDGLQQTKLTTDCATLRAHNRTNPDLIAPQPNSDLEWSMDFEHRKELATKRRRVELSSAVLASDSPKVHEVIRTSPHKNRYDTAIATLEAGYSPPSTSTKLREPFKTSLPDGDPRAYLMRRQKSQSTRSGEAPKMTRAKSSRLPLENIPEAEKTHNLVLGLSAGMDSLRLITKELMNSDVYMKNGNRICGLKMGGLEATGVASRVQAVIGRWMEIYGKENCEIEYKFENLVTFDEL